MSESAVLFDDTALLALGAGHRLLSRIVVHAEVDPTRQVHLPALCVTAAEAQRPGIAEHAGALPSLEVISLDYAAAATVGSFIRGGLDWRGAHAVFLARPTWDWPKGRPILTTSPHIYDGTDVHTIRIPDQP